MVKSDIFSLAQGSELSENMNRILTDSGIREDNFKARESGVIAKLRVISRFIFRLAL